jgi:predicted PurR-regulated permease PerM
MRLVYRANVPFPVSPEPVAAPPAESRAILRDLLIVAAVGAGIWVAHRLGRIVLVLILAMFLAYVIAPLVDLMQRPVTLRGRSRRLPAAGLFALQRRDAT